jgi:uncharacterized protein
VRYYRGWLVALTTPFSLPPISRDLIMSELKRSPEPLDLTSPFVVDVRQVGRRAGTMARLQSEVPAPAGLGLEMIRVPAAGKVSLDLRLESVVEGVLVSGTATMPMEGECGRCLAKVSDTLEVRLQELYAFPESATQQTTEEGEVSQVYGDFLDLEPVVRDAAVLALPPNPLCREECPGLCSECGVPWDALPDDHSHQRVDPRWAALQEIYRESPEGATESQEK